MTTGAERCFDSGSRASHPLASGFGECAACGCGVERVGWDDLCFRCQEAEKAELVDDDEEDDQ
jgi:hypothetical protein